MGKVKLARKEDGSEQVRPLSSTELYSAVMSPGLTLAFHNP